MSISPGRPDLSQKKHQSLTNTAAKKLESGPVRQLQPQRHALGEFKMSIRPTGAGPMQVAKKYPSASKEKYLSPIKQLGKKF